MYQKTRFFTVTGDIVRESGVEFRRGSAGGGNQIRQPYLKGIVPEGHHLDFPQTEHVHLNRFYQWEFPFPEEL